MEEQEPLLMGGGFLLGGDEQVLDWIVVRLAQPAPRLHHQHCAL